MTWNVITLLLKANAIKFDQLCHSCRSWILGNQLLFCRWLYLFPVRTDIQELKLIDPKTITIVENELPRSISNFILF